MFIFRLQRLLPLCVLSAANAFAYAEPVETTILNDTQVSPSIARLRDASILNTIETQSLAAEFGVVSPDSEFMIQDKSEQNVEWETLTISFGHGQSKIVAISGNHAELKGTFPSGETNLTFVLSGRDKDSKEVHKVKSSCLLELSNDEGLKFLLVVRKELFEELLNVQIL